ncbi:hypothetical protein GCM10027190_16050 [Spirosoma areae]
MVQAKPTPTDSLKVKQALMVRRLDSLSAGLQKLLRTNDSLNKELYYFRAKEDFYVMAVDRQGSHFEWLVGIALALAGLFTYGYFSKQIGVVKDNLEERIVEHEESFNDIKLETFKGLAVILNNTLRTTDPAGDFNLLDTHLNLYLAATYFLSKAYIEKKGKDDPRIVENISVFIGNMKELMEKLDTFLKESPNSEDQKRQLREQYDSLPVLDALISYNNDKFSSEAVLLKRGLRACWAIEKG